MRFLVIACLAGCTFQRASDRYACTAQTGCADDDRTCEDGFCVLKTEPADAAIDTAVVIDTPPDARPCTGGDANATDANGACFVAFLNAPKSRANAEADCVTLNMHLAAVRSDPSNDIVQSLVVGEISWLGATDLVTEGTFLWPDGTDLANYDNFRNGVPNDGGSNGPEDCLAIEGNNGGSWDDRPCGNSFAYVCGFEP